ncbi:hypothetical protein V2J09_004957 [Rumex salicifolius]
MARIKPQALLQQSKKKKGLGHLKDSDVPRYVNYNGNLRTDTENVESMNHEAFMLGTSKRKPNNKKGFELYITTAPIPDLNEKLTIFGQVVKGVEVVQEIEEVDTDEQFLPKSPITILDVTLEHTI